MNTRCRPREANTRCRPWEANAWPQGVSYLCLHLCIWTYRLSPHPEEGGAAASAMATMVARESKAEEVVSERPTESGSPGKGEEPAKMAVEPFMLSDTIPTVPAKMVAKIQKGEYVDNAELLWHNIELERRQASEQFPTCTGANHPNR